MRARMEAEAEKALRQLPNLGWTAAEIAQGVDATCERQGSGGRAWMIRPQYRSMATHGRLLTDVLPEGGEVTLGTGETATISWDGTRALVLTGAAGTLRHRLGSGSAVARIFPRGGRSSPLHQLGREPPQHRSTAGRWWPPTVTG